MLQPLFAYEKIFLKSRYHIFSFLLSTEPLSIIKKKKIYFEKFKGAVSYFLLNISEHKVII